MSKYNTHGRVVNSGSRARGDTYLTPPGLVIAGLRKIQHHLPIVGATIADFGAGIGTWGACARALLGTSVQLDGYENNVEYIPREEYTNWFLGDLSGGLINIEYDLIVMNPPFSLASDFVRTAMNCVKDGGSILMLAPLSFISPKKERRDVVDEFQPMQGFRLDPRPSYHWLYTRKKTTDVEDAVLLHWKKTWGDEWVTYFYMPALYWTYEDDLGVSDKLRQHPNMQVYKMIYDESRKKKASKNLEYADYNEYIQEQEQWVHEANQRLYNE